MIIADTGFWLALANGSDRHHPASRDALASLNEPLITTWPVVTETCHLLAARLGPDACHTFISGGCKGAYQVFALEISHLARISALMQKYRDLPIDLADASLVILAEHLGHGRILSTDTRDFHAYRWKSRKPFRNLLRIS